MDFDKGDSMKNIQDLVIHAMHSKIEQEVKQIDRIEQNRQRRIQVSLIKNCYRFLQEFDREYKETYDPKRFRNDYEWLNINIDKKPIQDKVKEEVVKHSLSKKLIYFDYKFRIWFQK